MSALFVGTTLFVVEAMSGETGVKKVERNGSRPSEVDRAFLIGLGRASDKGPEGEIRVSRYGRTLLMTGTLTGRDVKEEITCVLCTSEEALTAARSLGAVLAARSGSPEPALVTAADAGDGDDVLIDDVPLAPAVSVSNIEPGEHYVRVDRRGKVFEGNVDLKPGRKVDLSSEALHRRYDRAKKLRAASLVGGLGLSAIATGALFMWLDGNCSSNVEDPSTGKCVEQHELTAPGLSLIIGGALTETLLIWLLWPESDDSGGV